MAHITFEELIQAVQKLPPKQKALLVQSLHETSVDLTPTREELLEELEVLRKSGLSSAWRAYETNLQIRRLTT